MTALEQLKDGTQVAPHDVYESADFNTMIANMRKHFEAKGAENAKGLTQVQDDLGALLGKMKK
mgnify:CR=1 FL=1